MKRILSIMLMFFLLLGCLPTVFAEAEQPTVVLLGSDFQNNCYQPSYNRYYYDNTPMDEQPRSVSLRALLQSVKNAGITPDAALFTGDYTDHFQSDGDGAYCAGDGITQIRSLLDTAFGAEYTGSHTTLFSQGNHDFEGAAGLAQSGLQPYDDADKYLVYVINEKDFPYNQKTDAFEGAVADTAQALGTQLDTLVSAEELRPIFVLCHVPLHYSSRYNGADNTYAELIFNELNDAAAELNVFFLYGHNHSGASADYEADWGGAVNYVARGQQLDVNRSGHGSAGSNFRTLNFTYLNAGYTGYSTSATNDTRTVSVLSLYENSAVLSRYDAQGEYLRAESVGQTDPQDPGKGAVTNYPITVPLLTASEFTVSAESENDLYGTVRTSGMTASATAAEGYAVSGWVLSPADAATVTQNGAMFYFSEVTADCTLTVSFAETDCPSTHFTDVNPSLWYHDGIDFTVRQKLFNGVSANTFEPDTVMSRAMLVTVLYRMSDSPAILPGTDYSDVSIGKWYSNAVTWANVCDIVNGIGGGKFAPDAPVTREQVAVILCRYASHLNKSVSSVLSLDGFADAGSIGSYAADALQWAVERELIGGVGNNLLDPKGSATRAQVAVLLMRFSQVVLR